MSQEGANPTPAGGGGGVPSPSQPHVLLVSFPLQGHVNPLLRLGARLAARGLLVTFTTFRHAGLHALRDDDGDGARAGLRFEYLRDGTTGCSDPRHLEDKDPSEMLRHVADVGPPALARLIRRQADAGRPVACVVNNPFVPWALGVAGAKGIPCAMLWIQSCAVLSLYYHFYNDSPGAAAFPSGAAVRLPGLPVVAADELPFMVRPEYSRTLWSQMLRAQLGEIGETLSWVLVNTFDALERCAIDALRAHAPVAPVGPLLAEHGDDDGDDGDDGEGGRCMAWLDVQTPRSVVYVAFGSLVSIGRAEMVAVAEGLAGAGRPFLWVVRDNTRGLLPEDVLAACCGCGGRGRVVAWCPQGRVLGHGAVGCFVTHCGWNSVAEALVAGVPMVGYPWWSDQFTNAKFLVDEYRVGVRLPAPVTPDALRACVDEVMSGPRADAIRRRAAAWKDAAAAAVADGGSSDQNLQSFVQDIRRLSHEKRSELGTINSSGGQASSHL